MKKAEENLKLTYEKARWRAYDRLVADHDRVPQYYMAVIGSALICDLDEEKALEAIREFLDSPVGYDYIQHIQDTEDP